MGRHVILGAGPVGRATARLLSEQGHQVVILNRSGTAGLAGVEALQGDAAEVELVTRVSTGADVLYQCASPHYRCWPAQWPKLASAALTAAERNGTVLLTVSNLYGYGPVRGPLTEALPLAATGPKGATRARLWIEAEEAHRAGRVRTAEVRGADYLGPEVRTSHLGERVVSRILDGKTVPYIGDPDQIHSWTYVEDVSRLLVSLAQSPDALGRPWHVPTLPPKTFRRIVELIAVTGGARPPRIRAMPDAIFGAASLVSPMLKELREVRHQFTEPFHMEDPSEADRQLGLRPTPLEEQLDRTVEWCRSSART